MKTLVPLVVLVLARSASAEPVIEHWQLHAQPVAGPKTIDVARFDLAHYRLRIFAGDARPAPTWARESKLDGVINAGMFHESGAPVGLIVDAGNARGHDNAKMSGFLAWDPTSPRDPAVIMTGRDCG